VDLRPIDGSDEEIIAFDTNDIAVLSILDIKENDFPVKLYPNPATATVHFQVKNIVGDTQVKIYDISGKHQLNATMEGDQMDLDISKMSKGIYFVAFQNGEARSAIKMVVK